ncbi:hypothetical protein A9Q99_21080 [Gammaproteobacteria bacterium 45_16_T64]|nr:hypothetical protein A9Q99_21080 [Gammaproteobacteria bacterium 45_16_T64]
MSIGYTLVNNSKKEQIMFLHLAVSTIGEIQGNPVSCYIVNWYKNKYPSDDIEFVSDTYDDWPFTSGSRDSLNEYPDVTDSIVSTLIDQGVVLDKGLAWQDEDEPDTVFIRDLVLADKTEQV